MDSIQQSKEALRDAEAPESIKEQLKSQLESEKGFDMVLDSSKLGTAVDAEADTQLIKESAVLADTSMASEIDAVKPTDVLTREQPEDQIKVFTGEEAMEYAAKVVVTAEEKEAFLKAVTFDTRLELPFSIFGGKVKGVIRNRTLAEHNVLQAYLMAVMVSKQIHTDDEYQQQLRALVLAAQVQKLGDTEYPELKEPLAPQGDGQAPGWLEAYNMWLKKDGNGLGVTRAIFAEIQKFEGKYWSMLRQAENENFWSTAEST